VVGAYGSTTSLPYQPKTSKVPLDVGSQMPPPLDFRDWYTGAVSGRSHLPAKCDSQTKGTERNFSGNDQRAGDATFENMESVELESDQGKALDLIPNSKCNIIP